MIPTRPESGYHDCKLMIFLSFLNCTHKNRRCTVKIERTETEVTFVPETPYEKEMLDLVVRSNRGPPKYRDGWEQSGGVVFTVGVRDAWDPSDPGNR